MSTTGKKTAMISSTARDLPDHRKIVEHACRRMGFDPVVMEDLVATSSADAIKASMDMVDDGQVFIGVYAYRYGYVPDGSAVSITETEFNRAKERKIPRLVFLMHEDHPVKRSAIETGEAEKKLEAFKQRVGKEQIVRWFKSPEELRDEVFAALGKLISDQVAESAEKVIPDFHPPNVIPKPPEPYIAHPYSLLQTKDVVGRQAELNLLTDWVTTNKQVPADTRVFNLVAIGGMGKSALTWKWFNDIAPNEMPKLAGRMWWSFYESDAHYENFIIRALAYVSRLTEKEVRAMKSPDREDQLWQILDQQPFLLVLDGLERILLAYARMDAAQMLDDDLDEKTANRVARAIGLPAGAADSFVGKQPLRLTADHRAGQFLRRLARIRNSRLLITTRLYPIDLQAETGDPLPGCAAQFLTGLTDNDARNLWREFKVTGSAEQLLPLFRSFGNYPLLIRALAGEVARYRPAPRDFDKWRTDNPKFDPTRLLLKDAKTHVLEYALRGLPDEHRKVLHTIAAFRMPATWDTLRALLVESGSGLQDAATPGSKSKVKQAKASAPKPCPADRALDVILTELEDRGLVGWDKKSNRYDLHPIVRGVVWQALDDQSQKGIYADLRAYFDAVPRPRSWLKVESIEDLTPAIELYQSLIGLERFQDALNLFRDHIENATLYRLGASRQRAELVELLFSNGIDKPPHLQLTIDQSFALNALASAYLFRGEPGRAVPLFRRKVEIHLREADVVNGLVGLANLSVALRLVGALREAQSAARKAVTLSMEVDDEHSSKRAAGLFFLGESLSTCGIDLESEIVLQRSRSLCVAQQDPQGEGLVDALLAERLLWFGSPKHALPLALHAWELAGVQRLEGDLIGAARLHGTIALGLNDLETAAERLEQTLTRARAVNLVEEELPALTAFAELHRRKEEFATARELLDQIWDLAERGPYPLFHADALNVLAQVERDHGNCDAAIAAATKAYTLAWCDGPPYAYHYGLTNARKHLQGLGAPEPELPPFDESKFEPMPEVELNPKDEFWVDPDKLDSRD